MNISVAYNLKDYDVACLLCSALEGGSNYWYSFEKANQGTGDANPFAGKNPDAYTAAFSIGGSIVIRDTEADKPKKYTLDRAAMVRGLGIMATKYPKHFGNFMSEDGDAITGDVFLQCCVFGEVIYG